MECQTTKVESLFGTPLWLQDFPEAAQLNPILRRAAESEISAEPINPIRRTNRLGVRTAQFDLAAQPWAPLSAFIAKVVQGLLVDDLVWGLHTPGLNVHGFGGFNISHIHENCLLSGVYYISCPGESGDLVLEDPRVQAVFASTYQLFRHDLGSKRVVLTPHEGLLVLFPSWLSHHVEPSSAAQLRISLPINVVLRAEK
jgi:uncharacterized protein (TIGR02466 family)